MMIEVGSKVLYGFKKAVKMSEYEHALPFIVSNNIL